MALLLVLLVGQAMASMDASILVVAAPSIRSSLHASGAELQLIVATYTLTFGALVVTGARLGDVLGRRRAFVLGLGAFTVCSLVGGLADLLVAAWRPALLLNAPIGAPLLVASRRVLPPMAPTNEQRLDLPGAGLLAAAMLALVVPLSFRRAYGVAALELAVPRGLRAGDVVLHRPASVGFAGAAASRCSTSLSCGRRASRPTWSQSCSS